MRVTKSLPRASDASDAIPYSSHDAANRPNNDGSCVTMTNDAALDAALPAMQLARSGRGCGVRISSQLTAPKASGSEEAKPSRMQIWGKRLGLCKRVQGVRERARERACVRA
jgi:hypothetical protein